LRSIICVLMNKFFLISLLFLCAGCTPSKKKSSKNAKQKIVKQLEQSAMQNFVFDIPELPDAPLGFVLDQIVYDVQKPDNIQVRYRAGKQTVVDLTLLQQSCLADMELFGWNCLGQFQADNERVLCFARPADVLCQIRLQDTGDICITLIKK
jgi:hypothetical protein